MTETPSLARGEFAILDDGSVRLCGPGTGNVYNWTRAEQQRDGFETTDAYAQYLTGVGYLQHIPAPSYHYDATSLQAPAPQARRAFTALRDRGYITREAATLEEFSALVNEFANGWDFVYDAWCEGAMDGDTYKQARLDALTAGRVMVIADGKQAARTKGQAIQFPSGATVVTDGNKIVGRVEADANAAMLERDDRQPTRREAYVMACINLSKALAAELEEARKRPLPHPAIAGLLRG